MRICMVSLLFCSVDVVVVVVVVLIFWRFQSALTIYANLYGKILSFFYTFRQGQSVCLREIKEEEKCPGYDYGFLIG